MTYLTKEEIFSVFKEARDILNKKEEKEKVKKTFSEYVPSDFWEKYFSLQMEKTESTYVLVERGETSTTDEKNSTEIKYRCFVTTTNKSNLKGGAYAFCPSKIKARTKEGLIRRIKECRSNSLIDAVESYMDNASKAVKIRGRNALKKYDYLGESKKKIIYRTKYEKPKLSDISELEKLALSISKHIKEMKNIFNDSVQIDHMITEKVLVDSEGAEIIYDPISIFNIEIKGKVKTKEGDIMVSEIIRDSMLENIIRNNKIEKAMSKLERRCKFLERAIAPPTGGRPVILAGLSFGIAIHEAGAAHLFSLKYFANDEIGIYSVDDIGKKISSENLTVVLDPLLPGQENWGYYNIDDEGTEAKRIVMVERGVLKNLISDRKNVGKMKEVYGKDFPLNGHARAENITKEVEPRVSNLVIKWEEKLKSREEVLKDLLKEIEKLDEEPKNRYGFIIPELYSAETIFWEEESENVEDEEEKRRAICVLNPAEVYLVDRNGKFTPVLPTISFDFEPRFLLQNVVSVGGSYVKENHLCGSDSGIIQTSTISPSSVCLKYVGVEKSKIENLRRV